ncbi:hypothetical protein [Rhodococcus aetherivorans]|uniref:Rv3212 family protein n=1 Tax=Rhodococcus aetherivorans TaxID=191292 RepID=UPI001E4107B6|nr:hypothetical protein [Rhodococcus aetherivorans]UGQ43177.1 hypothetical protein LRQ66_07755 [Rhodococcus aetherivorans]
MLAPERRTRADLIAALLLAVAVVAAASVVWLRSDARGTVSVTTDAAPDAPASATAVPSTLTEAWRAPSGATSRPIAVGGVVVTGDGGTVTGRALDSGAELWRYGRDMPLCGVVEDWRTAVAVYRDQRGCSQVTQLVPDSGMRGAQRSSDADDAVTLTAADTHVISRGDTRLELWRSDLVRTLEYGRVDAPVVPGAQPRNGCTLRSAAASNTRLAVVERCPGEEADRLTLLETTPEADSQPKEIASSVLPELGPDDMGTRVVAVSGERTVLYLPPTASSGPVLAGYDAAGTLTARHPLSAAATPDAVFPAAVQGSFLTWWSGTETVALGGDDLVPRWTLPGTTGTGAAMAGALLLPVRDALAVVEPATGAVQGRIPVVRDEAGVVNVAVAGTSVLEQRGPQVVVLR